VVARVGGQNHQRAPSEPVSLRERRKVPRGQEHLRLIQQEAQEIVGQAFASASGAGGS